MHQNIRRVHLRERNHFISKSLSVFSQFYTGNIYCLCNKKGEKMVTVNTRCVSFFHSLLLSPMARPEEGPQGWKALRGQPPTPEARAWVGIWMKAMEGGGGEYRLQGQTYWLTVWPPPSTFPSPCRSSLIHKMGINRTYLIGLLRLQRRFSFLVPSWQ